MSCLFSEEEASVVLHRPQIIVTTTSYVLAPPRVYTCLRKKTEHLPDNSSEKNWNAYTSSTESIPKTEVSPFGVYQLRAGKRKKHFVSMICSFLNFVMKVPSGLFAFTIPLRCPTNFQSRWSNYELYKQRYLLADVWWNQLGYLSQSEDVANLWIKTMQMDSLPQDTTAFTSPGMWTPSHNHHCGSLYLSIAQFKAPWQYIQIIVHLA